MAIGEKNLPHWLRKHFEPKDLALISEAVRRAEEKTRGELVPVVVRHSAPIHGVLAPSVLFFVALFGFLERQYYDVYEPWSMLLALLAAVVFGVVCSRLEVVQRFFLPESDEDKAARERAELEFYREGVHHTPEKTGVLIFISLLERRVVVLADEGIAQKLPKDIWSGVVKQLIKDVREDHLQAGLVRAIETCGDLLAEHFPRGQAAYELGNDLIIKE